MHVSRPKLFMKKTEPELEIASISTFTELRGHSDWRTLTKGSLYIDVSGKSFSPLVFPENALRHLRSKHLLTTCKTESGTEVKWANVREKCCLGVEIAYDSQITHNYPPWPSFATKRMITVAILAVQSLLLLLQWCRGEETASASLN